MSDWFFVSDLHGQISRYERLFRAILTERPEVILLGGDLLPSAMVFHQASHEEGFIQVILQKGFAELKQELGDAYPHVFLILGNDDPRAAEVDLKEGESLGLWRDIHFRNVSLGDNTLYGYACVPPTPFTLKDWERNDISRYVDPGCISPEEGWYSTPVSDHELRYSTIQSDLKMLTGNSDHSKSIFLFHAPPYNTVLDRAELDHKTIDGVPMDIHVGSIAIRRFIETKQPLLTLHGHIHESFRLTGSWRECIGRTWAFSAAYDGIDLALIRFRPTELEKATRELV
jgi:Icc-related predicted phosphoesterase